MRIFLDANILISALNKEYPLFTYTSRILSLSGRKGYELFTSPVCLAIAFYFAEKKHGTAKAKQKISLLADHIKIADTTKSTVSKTLNNPAVHDFEDGLEYYSAFENKCTGIVTEDVADFYFSEIEVLTGERFFEKYMVKK